MSFGVFLLLLALSGLLSGLFAGLLGIGGGVITVPVLYYLLGWIDFPENRIMQVAISTSLATTLITSIASTWAHHQKHGVLFSVLRIFVPGLILGCVAGALLVHYLPNFALRNLFGMMALFLGIYFFFPRLPSPFFASAPNRTLSLFGLLVGCLSSLLGIGGGIFTVPILLGYRVPMTNAVATSSASTLTTAFVGSLTYLIIAWHKPELPYTFGYIELPAFAALSLASICTARLGVKLTHTLPTALIRRIFGFALAATGLAMVLA